VSVATVQTKRCSDCHRDLPLHAFYPDRAMRDGLCYKCKPCSREGARRWRLAHLQQRNEYLRRQRAIDPVKAREADRRYYRAADPWRRALWSKVNNANRAALKHGAPGRLTTATLAARWEYYAGRCWRCGEPATEVDHVIPFANGGTNWPANVRPACTPCNRQAGGQLSRP
jgi:5-methylcytosine-specific restriction endonuclease McrA